jgi:Zn-dependent protease with chaperone function
LIACGGGVLLLRWLGVIKPAPAPLTDMVTQLATQMKVSGRIKVFELEWAQVNALAWSVYRAVGFSRPMLQVMSEDEVRAVAAHELAHLTEPVWVRTVRVGHMFLYLPLAPLVRYGGTPGAFIGFVLLFTIMFGYQRFTRAFERRADHVEAEAIADQESYMRSMIKLHEANAAPAVMSGKQTHPHLYDRLLAAGIQPDFPRPDPPGTRAAFAEVLAVAILDCIVLFAALIAVGVALHFAVGWDPSHNSDDPAPREGAVNGSGMNDMNSRK